MAARGLRRDVRRVGELARGQRAAVEQRAQDVGAGRIADQCGDRGHIENFAHAGTIARRRAARHGANASAGPKLAAAIRRRRNISAASSRHQREEKDMPTSISIRRQMLRDSGITASRPRAMREAVLAGSVLGARCHTQGDRIARRVGITSDPDPPSGRGRERETERRYPAMRKSGPPFAGGGMVNAVARVFVELVAQRADRDAEDVGGVRAVAEAVLQRLQDQIALDVRDRAADQRARDRLGREASRARRQAPRAARRAARRPAR